MAWFAQLKETLARYYPADRPADIVGYLKGSTSPTVWMHMEKLQNRNQMIILGSVEPSAKEWSAAGVEERGLSQEIKIGMLDGFIILYGGFVYRPWGKITIKDDDCLKYGFPGSLRSWKTNMPTT